VANLGESRQYPIQIPQNILIGKPLYPVSLLDQPFYPYGVIGFLVWMAGSIDLVNQFLPWAEKIHDIRPDRVLAAEFEIHEFAVAQHGPEDPFGGRLVRPELAGEPMGESIGYWHKHCLPTGCPALEKSTTFTKCRKEMEECFLSPPVVQAGRG